MTPTEERSLKNYLPLIFVFISIVLFTFIAVLWSGNTGIIFILRMFMAGFFLIFGGFKIAKWKGFVEAYSMYDLIAKRSKVYGYAYPLIELGLGMAYFVGWNLLLTNIITLVVMSVGTVGVANELFKKNEIPCACLGTVFKIPMTKVTLGEDLLMAGMALGMIFLLT